MYIPAMIRLVQEFIVCTLTIGIPVGLAFLSAELFPHLGWNGILVLYGCVLLGYIAYFFLTAIFAFGRALLQFFLTLLISSGVYMLAIALIFYFAEGSYVMINSLSAFCVPLVVVCVKRILDNTYLKKAKKVYTPRYKKIIGSKVDQKEQEPT